MSNLTLPILKPGMVVVTPSTDLSNLTEDKKYIIEDTEEGWIMITDDTGEFKYYRSHFFIEADVYYNMILFLTLIRLLNIKVNYLK